MAAVKDAVLVAGGIGSRMLPASASVAKEAMPLVDVPALTHLAREAIAAGVERIHIITSPKKDLNPLLQDNSWLADKAQGIDSHLLSPFEEIEVLVHVQEVPRGFGDALYTCLHAINGPFLVLLGDNLLMDSHSGSTNYTPSSASSILVKSFEKTGLPCVGLASVPDPENYGVVSMDGERIVDIIEKPNRESAPTNLVLCGRYLFTSDTATLLEKYDFENPSKVSSTTSVQKSNYMHRTTSAR